MSDWKMADIGGLPAYRSPLLAEFPELVHGFFTRRGGLSAAPYESLNLSFAVGDAPEAVSANRHRVQRALDLDFLAGAAQVHGQGYAVITGSPNPAGELPEVDLLLTQVPGAGLLIKQADCQAVMLFDPVRGVAANVHCGWRGQVAGVLALAVRRLREIFDCRPQDLRVAVGPGLGPCCAEFRHFREEFPPEFWSYQVSPAYFDLWRLSSDQLLAAGLLPEHLDLARLCTRCRDREFFSYRRDGVTGRQGAIIALRP
jgi:hypothetical protein